MPSNRLIYGIIALIVVCAVAAYLFLSWSAGKTAHDNSLALASLNSKILLYGTNVRYLLSNSSTFYSALGPNAASNASYTSLYNDLTGISNPYGNLSAALSVGAIANQSENTGINNTVLSEMFAQSNDWYVYSPYVRSKELEELFNLGYFMKEGSSLPRNLFTFLSPNNAYINPTAEKQLGIPENVSPLQSMYELKLTGLDILSVAYVLAGMFKTGFFGSELTNITTTPTIGVGLNSGQYGADVPDVSETGLLNGNYYDLSSVAQMGTGWLTLISSMSGSYGLPHAKNATFLHSMFYKIALVQYLGYELSQIFYNVSIAPNIDFSYYANNTLALNLGNLNLTNPSITLYIDNNKTQFTRYYNNLISYNTHLGLGNHSISVKLDNTTLSAVVYVVPVLPSVILAGNLQLSFHDDGYPTLNISNISVECGIHPSPVILPEDKADILYNQSLQNLSTNCQSIRIINGTYFKFNKYTPEHDNYTGINYTVANYTPYPITQLNNFSLKGHDYVALNFSALNVTIGTLTYYTVTFDTNYGSGRSIIVTKAA